MFEMNLKSKKITVVGKVQGVFFRKNTLEKALQIGLKGNVRNQNDGSVFIQATGSDEQIKELITWCHIGSPNSAVDEVLVEEIPIKEFPDFAIVYA